MNITKATDYAFRFLTTLASEGGEGSCRDLAERIDVPFNHLAKLVQRLSNAGLLITKKGKGGGLKLSKPASQISLADVYEAIEGPVCLNDCLFHRKSCKFSSKCKVRKCLGKIQKKINKMLANQNIMELAV
ncbi:MAG: Rrf2 family transcriptional regulator [Candidatus Saganbacteria bacterium]|nr:Rrf2 family transcriptional regulator [Candidatus Saganbacteria bacterium]